MRSGLRYDAARRFIIFRDCLYIAGTDWILLLGLLVCFCFYFWWRQVDWNSFYKTASSLCLPVNNYCHLKYSVQRARQSPKKEALELEHKQDNTPTKALIAPSLAVRRYNIFCGQMKLTSNAALGACWTRACSIKKQMVLCSGFSLVWRRRNQLLAGYLFNRLTHWSTWGGEGAGEWSMELEVFSKFSKGDLLERASWDFPSFSAEIFIANCVHPV